MSQPPTKHWTTLGYLRPIFDYLSAIGQPLDAYLATLGLSEPDLSNADRRIENQRLTDVFVLAEKNCGDPNIGLHCGLKMQLKHIGIVGLLAMSCKHISELFELHTRYQTLVGDGLTSNYQTEGDTVCMTVVVPLGHPPLGRHDFEYSLAGWFSLTTPLMGESASFLRIELPYPQPDTPNELATMAGSPVSYGHDAVRVFFRMSDLPADLLGADPELKRILEDQAQKRLLQLRGEQTDGDPELASLREIIAERLAYGAPTLEDVANIKQISVRTLQRRLDQRATSYKQLLDEVRRDLGRKYIETPDLSLLDVAMMLGFSEQSSFNRAFKRWFDDSPGAVRQRVS